MENILKEFEETFSGVEDDGTYKECIAKDIKYWLKEKLVKLEKKTKHNILSEIEKMENSKYGLPSTNDLIKDIKKLLI